MAPPRRKRRNNYNKGYRNNINHNNNTNNNQRALTPIETQRRKNSKSSDSAERIAAIIDGTSETSSLLELVIDEIKTRCLRYAVHNEGVIGISEVQAIAKSHLVGSAASWLDTYMRPLIAEIYEQGTMIPGKVNIDPKTFFETLRLEYQEE